MEEEHVLTVGEMLDTIERWNLSRDTVFHFEGVSYFKLVMRGEKLLQIEWNESAYSDDGTIVAFRRAIPRPRRS